MLSGLNRAVEVAKGQSALAKMLGVKQAHVWWWLNKSKRVPAEKVLQIEQATGVPRHELRPDIYPPPPAAPPGEAA